jgi:hypothetical protein
MSVIDTLRPAALAALLCALPLTAAAQDLPVDLELVLAVDISGSIDEDEAVLQRAGYVNALRHPQVIAAIEGGMFGRIAVIYIEWAGDHHQQTVLDWTLINDDKDAVAFSEALAETPLSTGRWTSISGAIDYAVPLFDDNGFEGFRKVIDISGDGYNNRGRPVESARDEALAAGITINGLAIINERPSRWGSPPPTDLDRYFEERVIGGPGAFVMVAHDFTDFGRAILSKLLLEIAGDTPPPRDLAAAR